MYQYLQGNLDKYYKVHIWECDNHFYIRKLCWWGWGYYEMRRNYWWSIKMPDYKTLQDAEADLKKYKQGKIYYI